ncbi:MAG TPA: SDR family oxidoreductase, partial [Hyphomonadaceae bacterium]|nr:SDR family oxidoreductase [Hyphomonadaceae bacterium]
VAQEAVRRMRAGGRVINVASRGYLGGSGAAHYVASKAGVVAMTRSMAVELRWRGIRVNAVAPGMVKTRLLDDFGDMLPALKRLEPSGGAASPEKIAAIIANIASADADFVNGQVLLVDGGKSIGVPPL